MRKAATGVAVGKRPDVARRVGRSEKSFHLNRKLDGIDSIGIRSVSIGVQKLEAYDACPPVDALTPVVLFPAAPIVPLSGPSALEIRESPTQETISTTRRVSILAHIVLWESPRFFRIGKAISSRAVGVLQALIWFRSSGGFLASRRLTREG